MGGQEGGLGATARVPGEPGVTWEGWEDSAVPPQRVGIICGNCVNYSKSLAINARCTGILAKTVPYRIEFGLKNKEGIEKYQQFVREAAALVVKHGGSISGEHGDGQSKADLLPIMFEEQLRPSASSEIFDPTHEPRQSGERLPTTTRACAWDCIIIHGSHTTRFHYGEDNNFPETMLRCEAWETAVMAKALIMCPSYAVTRKKLIQPGANAVCWDVAGESHQGRLAKRRSQGRPRPMSGVQRLSVRLPHAQQTWRPTRREIPLALRGTNASAARLCRRA